MNAASQRSKRSALRTVRKCALWYQNAMRKDVASMATSIYDERFSRMLRMKRIGRIDALLGDVI